MDFIIGGLAGAGATLFSNPMDVVKIRLQMQGELGTRAETKKQYHGIFHAMYVIAKNDGLMALQKGLAPAMVLGFTMNAIRLGIYQKAEVYGWTKNKKNEVCMRRAIFWSGVGGMVGGFIGNPASVVKTRLQTAAHPSIAVGTQHSYTGMMDGIRQIYKADGIRGFFAGAEATCVRLAIGSAAQLTTYSLAKEALLAHGICKTSPFGLAFTASAISGVMVCLVVCPLDVATVRLYNQGSSKALYSGFLDCLTKIYKIEGIHGLYKGMGPLYLRMAPHTTVTLVIWDMLNHILGRNKNK